MKHQNQIRNLLLAGTAALTLTACGGSSDSSSVQVPEVKSSIVETKRLVFDASSPATIQVKNGNFHVKNHLWPQSIYLSTDCGFDNHSAINIKVVDPVADYDVSRFSGRDIAFCIATLDDLELIRLGEDPKLPESRVYDKERGGTLPFPSQIPKGTPTVKINIPVYDDDMFDLYLESNFNKALTRVFKGQKNLAEVPATADVEIIAIGVNTGKEYRFRKTFYKNNPNQSIVIGTQEEIKQYAKVTIENATAHEYGLFKYVTDSQLLNNACDQTCNTIETEGNGLFDFEVGVPVQILARKSSDESFESRHITVEPNTTAPIKYYLIDKHGYPELLTLQEYFDTIPDAYEDNNQVKADFTFICYPQDYSTKIKLWANDEDHPDANYFRYEVQNGNAYFSNGYGTNGSHGEWDFGLNDWEYPESGSVEVTLAIYKDTEVLTEKKNIPVPCI